MEVCACPTRPRRARLSSLMWWVCADQRSIEFCSALVSAVLRSLFYAIFTSFFGVVGTTVGAMTGAVSGLKNKRGFFHGAAIGAIAGAYFSVEFVKASFDFFNSYDDEPLSFPQFDFQVGEVVGSLPLCHHMFHRPCIAKWRTRHSSCPLCRRNQ
ncbi:RING/U-box superfamily protein [Actinidia rufa]|uniref:RING/U-box superfamily protein n=1 Tax=Actinidia rufa TaxID=165716 RepID=A0A7J0DKC3_9ERIC|nr:RING/U-box superfamily protein [Actinidia rufa]